MSKEEIEKAKEISEDLIELLKKDTLNINKIFNLIKEGEAIKTLLQYMDQLEQENNKLNKMNNEMTKQLGEFLNIPNRDDCFIPREYSDINDCVKKASCQECIKQYFEEKVEEK